MDLENKYGTLEIQRGLLVLLKEFDSFCLKEGIQYSVAGGTMLGTIRHKGFIPWDDDLDVILTRDNYDKLKLCIHSEGRLQFVDAEDTDLWVSRVHLLDGKKAVQDVTLDLLILDNAPENPLKDKMLWFKSLLFQGMLKTRPTTNRGSLFMRFCSVLSWIIGRPFSTHTIMRWYHKTASRYNNIITTNMAIWMDQYSALWKRYPSNMVKRTVRLPFEDITVSAFADYDTYLRIAYGDSYMIPPKESERVPLHVSIKRPS